MSLELSGEPGENESEVVMAVDEVEVLFTGLMREGGE